MMPNRAAVLCVAVTCLLPAASCVAQKPPGRFTLESKAVGAAYTIEVVVPGGQAAGGKKLPVIYCTDWFVLGDYLKSLPRLMDMGRLTEPHIMVGISAGATMNDWAIARTRDFTPDRPVDSYSKENTFAPALELAGGSERFIAFLKDELIPRVETDYPTDPARRAFAGYSLGGLLATQLLAREPQLFQYFLIGSPSLWHNEYRLAAEFEKTPEERLRSIKKIYLSVGEEESWEMLKGFGLLRGAFQHKGFTDPRIKAEIIPDAGHVGAMPIALYNGIRFLFERD
jgi:predicted alpha/beta superfamily hydrolase